MKGAIYGFGNEWIPKNIILRNFAEKGFAIALYLPLPNGFIDQLA
jgi:hypothetical protein